MSLYVYAMECDAFDGSGACTHQFWVLVPSWTDSLPSVDDGNAVGGAIFVACATVAVMKKLLKPQKEIIE
jgi:hypothetical protein